MGERRERERGGEWTDFIEWAFGVGVGHGSEGLGVESSVVMMRALGKDCCGRLRDSEIMLLVLSEVGD